MNSSTALSERRLLNRIQLRLIIWYVLAFLAFEMVVVGATYAILREHILTSSYDLVQREWTQKIPGAFRDLEKVGEGNGIQTVVDHTPETIATWVVAANGQVIEKDTLLALAPGSLDSLFHPLIQDSRMTSSEIWQTGRLNGVPVLTGAHPLFEHGTYLGTVVSAYSLRAVFGVMNTLLLVDLRIALFSIVVILLLTFFLSRRSLLPIRLALHRQRNFVNDAAHELRTPLTVLRGTLELAKQSEDKSELIQAVNEGLEEVDYIARLVGDLSILARLESGSFNVVNQELNISEVVVNAVDTLRPFAEDRQIELTCEGSEQVLMVLGDRIRLRQLMFILLENAIKYSRERGRVIISIERARNHVYLRVTDFGIGIAPSDVPHVFDRFYRSSDAEQFVAGSGIGLAIAAWIVETHHGKIDVRSQLGLETTFTVLLPIAVKYRFFRTSVSKN
jgi:signal transduction histidine kinase